MTQKNNVQVNYELKVGDVLNIYTDFKEEEGYEGKAILLKKLKGGDSYYLRAEDIRPQDKKEYSRKDIEQITKYNRLTTFFKGNKSKSKKPDKLCRRLYKELLKERNDELDDFDRMKVVIDRYRNQYNNTIHRITNVLKDYDDYYLARYIQQDNRTWRPSIFSYERWKVRFIEDQAGWEVDWTTARNIRILKCYNPREASRNNQLRDNTTYEGGIPSKDYERIYDINEYNRKKKKEAEKNESIFIDDDEMEELILTRLKKLNNEKRN